MAEIATGAKLPSRAARSCAQALTQRSARAGQLAGERGRGTSSDAASAWAITTAGVPFPSASAGRTSSGSPTFTCTRPHAGRTVSSQISSASSPCCVVRPLKRVIRPCPRPTVPHQEVRTAGPQALFEIPDGFEEEPRAARAALPQVGGGGGAADPVREEAAVKNDDWEHLRRLWTEVGERRAGRADQLSSVLPLRGSCGQTRDWACRREVRAGAASGAAGVATTTSRTPQQCGARAHRATADSRQRRFNYVVIVEAEVVAEP